ncbi:hypothetical protein JOD57_002872 [Geodermatophilus bullaregiensis]|uniref:hypothetical protein n=1 Tax=Geodermatophilus bullaregiensis TaxID=1564160 RepID=UPI00195E199B|nr:hypothetical protein [Geodermatophilus bullaregiensis]MBM7807035.1 hypothetical protein [Geodermatophilus bullaregiensis]
MPVGTTPPRPPRPVLTTGLALLSTVAGLLVLGVATAPPAAAIEDPTRPDALVTHGPSCRPGGVVVEVTAGTVAYAVTLATTRRPEGEDRAEVQPGATVVLRTDPVDWGEAIDSRLEYVALDGSGTAYVDELEGHDYTRPAEEDCAAIAAPPAVGEALPGGDVPAPSPGPSPAPSPDAAPAPVPPAGAVPVPDVLPVPELPAPETTPGSSADGPGTDPGAASASARQVPAGGEVVLTGTGFAPGEEVTVRDADGTVLATVPAGPDGAVEITVRVPGGAGEGTTTVELTGSTSAVTAAVRLQVAAAGAPVADPLPVPMVAAGLALLVSATGLVLVAARRRSPLAPPWPTGSA